MFASELQERLQGSRQPGDLPGRPPAWPAPTCSRRQGAKRLRSWRAWPTADESPLPRALDGPPLPQLHAPQHAEAKAASTSAPDQLGECALAAGLAEVHPKGPNAETRASSGRGQRQRSRLLLSKEIEQCRGITFAESKRLSPVDPSRLPIGWQWLTGEGLVIGFSDSELIACLPWAGVLSLQAAMFALQRMGRTAAIERASAQPPFPTG